MAEVVGSWGSRLVITAIGGYQKHLSPRKGWKCAHRVLHGGESCSQWAKTEIAQRGCWAAWPSIRARFAECKVAAQTSRVTALEAQSAADSRESTSPSKRENKRHGRGHGCDGCDPCLPADVLLHFPSACGRVPFARLGDAACDCGPGDTGCIDCGACACWP